MKRKSIWKWIISLIVILCLVIFSIVVPKLIEKHIKTEYRTEQKTKHDEMVKTVYKHKNIIENFVKKDDKYHHIKYIQIEENSVNHNPMGGYDLRCIVNKNNKLNYGVNIDKNSDSNKVYVTGGDVSPELENLLDTN